MIFFLAILVVTLIGAALNAASVKGWGVKGLGVKGLGDWPARMRLGLAVALVLTGIDHLATPGRYIPMIEGFVPFAGPVVYLTGLCEIAGAVGGATSAPWRSRMIFAASSALPRMAKKVPPSGSARAFARTTG